VTQEGQATVEGAENHFLGPNLLAATAELVMEEERLSEEDKQLLTASLTDLVSETPRTTLAATRVKRIAGKVGGAFKAAMYKFAVDCASETAKKIVLGE
jgi:hypothetical protein